MKRSFLALVLVSCATAAPQRPSIDALRPPVAAKKPKDVTVHGDRRIDDYFWLREKDTPEVLANLRAEAAYAEAATRDQAPLRDKLYAEMLSHLKEDDASVPYLRSGWLWSSRTEKGKQYTIYTRRHGKEGADEPVLDLNELGRGKKFISLDAFEPSDDAALLAYTTDETGYRQYTLHVRDLRSGKDLGDSAPRVDSVAWAADGKSLYYVEEDEVSKRAYRLHRLVLSGADEVLYEEKDERFDLDVARSRDRAVVFVSSNSKTQSEVRFFGAGEAKPALRVIEPRSPDHQYAAEHRGDQLFIRTNDKGRNFRLVTAPVAAPGRASWKELVAQRDDVMLADVDLFRDFAVLRERAQGLPQLTVLDLATSQRTRIEVPEAAYEIGPAMNAEFDAPVYRFDYESFITPPSVFEYDVKARTRTLLKETPVPSFDRSQYVVERFAARAADGVEVPVSLVHRKDMPRDGSAPLFLYGYGSYGISMPVNFNASRFSLIDRGVTYAIAHIRGGGELSKKWHDAGRMMEKRNTFTDFIAAAESLVAAKVAARDRIAIQGGSAGGLLMGAVLNLRPDLFRAALVGVPFVDVINTMLDESLPETVSEFEEWGNPKIPEQYKVMRSYSPYDNIEAKAYPAMLVRSAYNDSQVMYWEPAKYVAKLRALKTDSNPLIFRINLEPSGHGGASGRYDRLRDVAADYAWALWELGIRQ